MVNIGDDVVVAIPVGTLDDDISTWILNYWDLWRRPVRLGPSRA